MLLSGAGLDPEQLYGAISFYLAHEQEGFDFFLEPPAGIEPATC